MTYRAFCLWFFWVRDLWSVLLFMTFDEDVLLFEAYRGFTICLSIDHTIAIAYLYKFS